MVLFRLLVICENEDDGDDSYLQLLKLSCGLLMGVNEASRFSGSDKIPIWRRTNVMEFEKTFAMGC